MPVSSIVAVIFFMMLITLGLGSVVSYLTAAAHVPILSPVCIVACGWYCCAVSFHGVPHDRFLWRVSEHAQIQNMADTGHLRRVVLARITLRHRGKTNGKPSMCAMNLRGFCYVIGWTLRGFTAWFSSHTLSSSLVGVYWMCCHGLRLW